ncbi:MAG: RNA polymerase sigma factor [Acidobacteriota bacterium]
MDEAFERFRRGDQEAFAAWVRLVEIPLRQSLRSFAQAVDVEAILQEGLIRMWRLAPRLEIRGENCSLRFATRMVRNLAISETRRMGRFTPLDLIDLERLPQAAVQPGSPPDPSLRRIILECLKQLPRRPAQALRARLKDAGARPDRELAEMLDMRLNTFLQNIVRGRKLMAQCLETRTS